MATRLTARLREAFVLSVMNDVPEVDYVGQVRKFVQERVCERMPPSVFAVYDNKTLRHLLSNDTFFLPVGGLGVSVYCLRLLDSNPLTAEDKDEVRRLSDARADQRKSRRATRERLSQLIAGFTTIESAAKALPELAKYLPTPAPKPTPNLPAVTGIIADLSKLGWPKGEKQ